MARCVEVLGGVEAEDGDHSRHFDDGVGLQEVVEVVEEDVGQTDLSAVVAPLVERPRGDEGEGDAAAGGVPLHPAHTGRAAVQQVMERVEQRQRVTGTTRGGRGGRRPTACQRPACSGVGT